jgi:hypothetical protein
MMKELIVIIALLISSSAMAQNKNAATAENKNADAFQSMIVAFEEEDKKLREHIVNSAKLGAQIGKMLRESILLLFAMILALIIGRDIAIPARLLVGRQALPQDDQGRLLSARADRGAARQVHALARCAATVNEPRF